MCYNFSIILNNTIGSHKVLNIIELTNENFSSFGKVLSGGNFEPVSLEEEFSWKDISGGLNLFSPSCTGQLNCRYRDRVLKKMESHSKTPEIMVALKGDSLLCVAPAGISKPVAEEIQCFSVAEGMALMMNTAVWHWIPYPLEESGSQFLVLFRDGTGGDDLHFHTLEQSIII